MDLRHKFNDEMESRIAELSAGVASGSCETIEKYRESAGFIKGLKTAKDIFSELWKQLE